MLFQYRCLFSLHQAMMQLCSIVLAVSKQAYSSNSCMLRSLAFSLLLSSSMFSHAEYHPIGAPFQVNTSPISIQSYSTVSRLNNDGFVVVWGNENTRNIDAQRYQVDGSPDGEVFQVNSSIIGMAAYPSVSSFAHGGFIISWLVFNDNTDRGNIYARRYRADGTRDGDEFQVNTDEEGRLGRASVSSLNNDGFIISWQRSSQDFSTNDIYAQLYRADGTPNGDEFQVDTSEEGSLWNTSVSSLNNGSFIISWDYHTQNLNIGHIYAQRYQADGSPIDTKFKVNTSELARADDSSMSSLNNGGFIISWNSYDPNSNISHIYAQRYQADGTPNGDEFQVNTDALGSSHSPSVSSLHNGGFVISWSSNKQNPQSTSNYAQSYHADGSYNGDVFQVPTIEDRNQYNPSISGLNNGDLVIIWENVIFLGNGNGYDTDIYAQRYQAGETVAMTLAPLLQTLYEGEQVSLDVMVSGRALYGIDGMLTTNEAGIITFTNSQYGNFFAEDKRIGLPSTVTENKWQGALTLMEPTLAVTGSGTFATVSYIAEQVGSTHLTLKAQFSGQQGQLLLDSSTDYNITVKKALNISGNVASLGIDGSYDNVRILINGQVRGVETDGSFHLKTRPGEVTIRVEVEGFLSGEKQLQLDDSHQDTDLGVVTLLGGDCNGDNNIDIADLTLLLAAYRSQKSDGDPYTSAADFNRDNQINIQDLSLLGSNFGKQGPQSW